MYSTWSSINLIRQQALLALWSKALGDVIVRYPNPSVHVHTGMQCADSYSWAGAVYVRLEMSSLPDTVFGSSKQLHGFKHLGCVNTWPGRAAAKAYISSLWVLYLAHEAQELVTHKGTRHDFIGSDAAVNPHEPGSQSQMLLERCQYPGNMAVVMDWAIGSQQTAKLLAYKDANKELAEEIANWTPSC